MKVKGILFYFLAAVSLGLVAIAFAEPHWNNQVTLVSEDEGDSIRPFSVSVSSNPTLVYYSTQTAMPKNVGYVSPDRFLSIENTSTFNLFCSTSSGFTSGSGNRFEIFGSTYPVGNIWGTYSAPTQIWCAFETAFGSGTKEILGWVGFDSQD